MEIHGDGRQTEDSYVTDTVDGFVRALERPEARSEVVNVGGTETLSILELAQTVQEHLGIPLPLRATFIPYDQFPGNYQDVRHRVPDDEGARAARLRGAGGVPGRGLGRDGRLAPRAAGARADGRGPLELGRDRADDGRRLPAQAAPQRAQLVQDLGRPAGRLP